MPGLDQVGGHAAAHIAEADEGDPCHDQRPFQLPARFSTNAVMPSALSSVAVSAVEQAALELDALRERRSRTRR